MLIKNYNIIFLKWFTLLIPISLVSGSLVLNLNLILITFSLLLYFFYDKQSLTYLKSGWFKIAILFLFLQIFSSLINDAQTHSIIRSVGFVKFIGLTMALLIIFEKDYNNFLLFLKILFFVSLFIIFDSLVQFTFEVNLFGNKYSNSRLTSIFGNEKIVGAFLSKIGFIISILPLLIIKNQKLRELIIFMILGLFLLTILLSGERMASLLFIMGISLYFLIKTFYNLRSFLYLLLSVVIIAAVFLNSNNILKRFQEISHDQYGLTKEFKIKDSVWGAHFLTAYEIFKNYPVVGVGPKNFRIESCKKKYENIDSSKSNMRCSTHPHNIVFEILSELGFLGMSVFLLLLYNILKSSNLFRETQLLIFLSLLIYIWPIGSSGSIFTSWNGTFLWLNFAVYLFIKKNKNLSFN